MTDKEINIRFKEYDRPEELTAQEQELVCRAISAMDNAYAPYSHFHVGAALLLNDQTVVTGSNQENAAYPSGLCAERVALFFANAQHPGKTILKLAIAGGLEGNLCDLPITPCGACRQVMQESEQRQRLPFEVILVGKNKIVKIEQAMQLLPFAFDGDFLK